METLKIRNLASESLNTDLASWDLAPEFITDGANFRCSKDYIEGVKASISWVTSASSSKFGRIFPIRSSFWVAAGRDAVYIYDGSTWDNISSAVYTYTSPQELDWGICFLGSIPILNNSNGYPEYWSPQAIGTNLQHLMFDTVKDWATQGITCKSLRSHKNYLIAMNLTEGAVDYPNAYRVSHPADINGLPASWDETDTAYIAIRAQIGGDFGDLIDGLSLKDLFMLYSTNGVNALYPSGDEFIWARKPLSSVFGILSKDTITEVKGRHYAIGDGDIIVNDGTRIESIIDGKLRRRLNSRINVDYYDRSYVFRHIFKKEIWFCVCEGPGPYPDTAYVYNWTNGKWTIQDILTGVTHSAYGLYLDALLTYATTTDIYSTTILTYAGQTRSPINNKVIGVETLTDTLHILDPATAASSDSNAWVSRENLNIGQLDQWVTITRVYPFFETGDSIKFSIGSRSVVDGPITWKGPFTFTPGTDRKIDVKLTGLLFDWKIESVGNGTFKFKGMDIEYSLAGNR